MDSTLVKSLVTITEQSPILGVIVSVLSVTMYGLINNWVQDKKLKKVQSFTFKERKSEIEERKRLVKTAAYEIENSQARINEISRRSENEIMKMIEGAFDILRLDISTKFIDAVNQKKKTWVCTYTNMPCNRADAVAEANISGYEGELLKAFAEGERLTKGFIKFNGFMTLSADRLEDYCQNKNREINKKIWHILIQKLPKDLIEGFNEERGTEEYTLKRFREIVYNTIEIKKNEIDEINKEIERKELVLKNLYSIDDSTETVRVQK